MSAQGPVIGTAAIRLTIDATGVAAETVRKVTPEIARANRVLTEHAALLGRGGAAAQDFRRGALAATLSVAGLRGAVLAAGTGFLGGAGLINAMQMFIGLSAQFERSMAQFQAVTHASAGELRAAREEAIALGRDIKLPQTSAGDAAEAMTELARGGLDVQQSMNAARGSLQLAAAAGSDFADAAAIQARALNAFALSGDQAVRVADVLANTANISSGEISDFALALQQSAAVAHQANFSIEETAAALAELANAGLTGSDAGTSLRTMILRLIPQTTKAAEAMKDLGVSATDANGQFLPLQEIIRRYHDALVRLTPAQRALTLQTIFGQDAIRAANIIFGQGSRIFEQTRAAVERQGAAAQLAAARNRGLAGTFDALRSNVESIFITLGQRTLPGLTEFVRGINQSVTGLSQSRAAADALETSAQALFSIFHGIGTVITAIGPAISFVARGAAGLADIIGGPAIATAVVAWVGLGRAVRLYGGIATRVTNIQRLLTSSSEVAANSAENIAKGQGRRILVESQLVRTQQALIVSTEEVAAANAQAAASSTAAATGAARQAQATGAAAAATATSAAAVDVYVAALVGQVAAEEAVVNEARQAALAQTALRKETLATAVAMEEQAAVARARLAAQLAGTRQRTATGQFISTAELQREVLATQTLATASREAVKAQVAVTGLAAGFRNFGNVALSVAGGWPGLIIIGAAAAAVAIQKFYLSGKSAMERFREATDALGESITNLAQAQDDLIRARETSASQRLSVQEARLNVQYALGEVQLARASGDNLRLRAAKLQLARANQTLEDTERSLGTAQEQEAQTRQRLRGLSIDNTQAANAEVKALRDGLDAFLAHELASEDFAKAKDQQAFMSMRAAAALRDEVADLHAQADAIRDQRPLFAHQLDMIAELTQQLGRLPTRREVEIILNVRSTRGPGARVNIEGFLIGETDQERRAALSRVEAGRARTITTLNERLKPLFRKGGEEQGREWAEALARGIETNQSVAADAARRAVARVAAEGEQEIQRSILAASSNLISIGQSISEQISELIDQGPLGQRIRQLQDQLEAAQRAAQRLQLTQGLRDATRDLARAREQLDPSQEIGLTPAQIARRRQAARDFLQPFEERRDQAKEALREFTVEGVIAQLQKAEQAQKEAVTKGIGDVIAAFAAGRIKADDAISQLARIIGGAKQKNNFGTAGKNLGLSFVLGFGGAVQSLFDQINAINQVPAARRRRAGFPRPEVERPAETIARVREQILAAEEARRKATVANTKSIDKLTTAILTSLGRGVPGARAQRRAARGAGGRVTATPPRPGGVR